MRADSGIPSPQAPLPSFDHNTVPFWTQWSMHSGQYMDPWRLCSLCFNTPPLGVNDSFGPLWEVHYGFKLCVTVLTVGIQGHVRGPQKQTEKKGESITRFCQRKVTQFTQCNGHSTAKNFILHVMLTVQHQAVMVCEQQNSVAQ